MCKNKSHEITKRKTKKYKYWKKIQTKFDKQIQKHQCKIYEKNFQKNFDDNLGRKKKYF